MMIRISETALITRIRRALAKEGQTLRKTRSAREWPNLGDYYIIDLSGNFVVDRRISDLEELGRELEVLKPYESVVNDEEDAQ